MAPTKLKPIPFLALFRYADRSDIALNALGLFSGVVSGILYPMTTLIFGELIDVFAKWQRHLLAPDGLTSEVASKSFYFLYLAAVEIVFTYLAMATFVYTGDRQVHIIRKKYLRAVLRQNAAWFDKIGAGEITTRLTSDTLYIQDAMSEKVSLAATQVATFIAGFALAFYRSWRLTLVLLAVIPAIVISAGISNVIAGKFQVIVLNKYSKAGSLAEEVFAAIRTLTAFGAQLRMSDRYSANISGATVAAIKKEAASGIGIGFLNGFIYCGYSLTFWYSYHLIADGVLSAGAVINVFFAVLIGAFSLGQIAPEMQALALGRSAAANVFETIDRVPTIDPYDHNGETITDLKGKIELKDIEFTYPARPESKVLNKVSLTVEPGTTVALVGPSGSGKSTIVQLVERFYDPDAGIVTLDGKPLHKLSVNWLRKQIGFVQQEPILFEGSIAENVAYGLSGHNLSKQEIQAKIEEACRKANAHDFIMKLSEKYDTPVGARGALLSGGQKQRIAIARAIVNNPTILLFDEATAALDSNSEAAVQKTLDEVSRAHTTIVVAHRLSTVKNADLIVVMRNGEVIEKGTHASLIAEDGLYAKLVAAQSLDTEINEQEGSPENAEPERAPSPRSSLKSQHKNSEKDFVEVKIDEPQQNVSPLSACRILGKVMKLNAPEMKYSIPAFISAIAMGLSYPLFSIALSSVIEVFAAPGPNLKHDAEMWATIFLLIGIGALVFSFLQQFLFGLASSYLTERLRKLLFSALLRQEINFFDKPENSTGALTSKLASDAQNIQGASGSTLGTILQILTNIVGGMVIALIYGWRLALVAISCLPVIISAGMFRFKILVYFYEKNKLAYEKSAQLACEAAAGIKTVQALTYEEETQHKYSQMLEIPLQDGFKNAWFNSVFYAIAQSINFLVNALVFWYGGELIAYQGYGIKQFMTVFVAVVFGSMSAGRILAFAPDFNKAQNSANSIISVLNRTSAIDPHSTTGQKPTDVRGSLEFHNVTFHYPQRPELRVLEHLNIKIKPGQFVALVGPSGSGKSTTIQLLERFYDASEGDILLDDINITKINIGHYRNLIGLVSQEPNLFDMSVLENICLGLDKVPPMEQVESACRSANIHEFIMKLEHGYNTNLGGKGTQLSGGQKQRIAIARALIRNPKILLLDEATSALDTESEKIVQEALDAASKGRTTVAIAHRLSTIQRADVIYVLKDGKIVDYGDHSTLFNRKGLYYELVLQQTLKP